MQYKEEIEIYNDEAVSLLVELHKKIRLRFGSLDEEYPEQIMAVSYIKPTDNVLEIGGNIGRNSCIIGSLLNNSSNMVVIESDVINADKLKQNRDTNGLKFHIEDCAISNEELYQKDWITKKATEVQGEPGWKKIKTKTWDEIKEAYSLRFDTLVADCEGALYYILKENPDFLQTFDKIIIENDFLDITHKHFVDNEFKRFGLRPVFTQPGGFPPCQDFFYEVWMK